MEAKLPQRFDTTYKGKDIVLSNDSQTAQRISKHYNGGFGGVISSAPLKEDEIFQFSIEETTGEYQNRGRIAFGVISEKKAEVKGALHIFDRIQGTWAIYGFGSYDSIIYKDGDILEGNNYPLNTNALQAGTVLGVKLHSNGDLHFYLNGEDNGVAFKNVPKNVFAFVDVINKVTQISIL